MAEAVVLCTQDYSGLGLALLMQQQGSTVVCGYQYDYDKQEDLEHVERIGDGLLPKMALDTAIRRYAGNDTLWVFDSNLLAPVADRLDKRGESVIGTSLLAARMEDDRDYAASIAERVGLDMPETERFTDYGKALVFLQQHEDTAYAFKPYKGDPSSTYVPLSADPGTANAELQAYLHSLEPEGKPQFILQEIVHGVEVAFDLWLRHGEPIAAFCDIEAKRKLNNDLGELIGCAGDYTFSVPLTCRGIRETVGKYLSWELLHNYTGSVDVNVSIVNGKPLFFENCFRFAYAAYPATFHSLTNRRTEDVLRDWIAGTGPLGPSFQRGFAGALTLTTDNAKTGYPLLIPDELWPVTDLYRAFKTDGRLALIENWPEILAVTSYGNTIEQVSASCLDLARRISFPSKGYRTDLGSAELPTLPLARYRALAATGYFA